MIEGADTVIINFSLGLAFGLFPMIFILRGLLPNFLSARFGSRKYLLRLHMPDGYTVNWRVGKLVDGGGLVYKVGKEEFLTVLKPGVAKRSLGVSWVDVDHGNTAPYNYRKVVVEEEKGKDAQGEERVFSRIANFAGWDDSAAVMVILRTALMQPRKGMALGNIDFKKVFIVGIILIIAVYVVTKAKSGGSII